MRDIQKEKGIKQVLVDTKQAGTILACEPSTVRKWIAQGRLPSVKVGRLRRIRVADLEHVAARGLAERGSGN